MTRAQAIPVKSTETNLSYQNRQGNLLKRYPRASVAVGAMAAVATLAIGAINHFKTEGAPTIGVHLALVDCKNGHTDKSPQPMALYKGQEFTVGVGNNALKHTVTLQMAEGGLLEQKHVDDGVTLKTAALSSTSPDQRPTGVVMDYTLDGKQTITITSHPGAGPNSLLTPIDIIRPC